MKKGEWLGEQHYTKEELLFLQAVDRYQHEHGITVPSWVEMLRLLRQLGYRKVAPEAITPSV